MRTMSLTRFGLGHVEPVEAARPAPGPTGVLVKVLACGVCHTDIHIIDGELPNPATKYDDPHAAPFLCAGLIGHRAYRMAGSGLRIGVYGFGAAAHIITQVARYQGREVYAFVTPGDDQALKFARAPRPGASGG
jgi:D-arabinose 1-dehydrogenase-like Zn-dependent alcohol dehydrogenase